MCTNARAPVATSQMPRSSIPRFLVPIHFIDCLLHYLLVSLYRDRFASGHVFEEAAQLIAAGVVLQFEKCLGFNLANALARDLENSTRFLERVTVPVSQTVTQADDLPLAVRQCFEDA